MNIIINKNIIDFKLESETTLGQILPDLLNHMSDSGYYNPIVKVDGVSITFHNNDWKDIAIDKICDLSLDARNVLEIEENINIIDNALFALEDTPSDMDLTKLIKEWDLFCASLSFWLFDFHFDSSLFSTIKQLETIWSDVQKRTALSESGKSILNLAKKSLVEKSRELDNPIAELLHTVNLLNADIENLDSLGSLFQKGNDSKAFNIVSSFTEHFQKFIRCQTFIDDEEIIDVLTDFISKTSEKLNELVKSLEVKNYTLASDLAEYEILVLLRDYLPKIETLLNKKIEN